MPEVTEKVFYKARTKAILDEDELKLSVTLSAPYSPEGKRHASITVDSGFSKTVREELTKALSKARDSVIKEAVQQAKEAALEAANFARNKGEEV
jgi:hypothetical protein